MVLSHALAAVQCLALQCHLMLGTHLLQLLVTDTVPRLDASSIVGKQEPAQLRVTVTVHHDEPCLCPCLILCIYSRDRSLPWAARCGRRCCNCSMLQCCRPPKATLRCELREQLRFAVFQSMFLGVGHTLSIMVLGDNMSNRAHDCRHLLKQRSQRQRCAAASRPSCRRMAAWRC